jgi:hypothetical protein
MSPPPRSLTFVVSTSLLTASLSLAACDEPKEAVNPGPADKADKGSEEDHVNVGPETPPPEPIHVNEGPEPVPTPPQPVISVNPGPEPVPPPQPVISVNPGPEPVPPASEEPKRVNTRPEP